jgi:hypothetical protein
LFLWFYVHHFICLQTKDVRGEEDHRSVEEDLLIGDVARRFLIGAPARSVEDAVAGKHKRSVKRFVVCFLS